MYKMITDIDVLYTTIKEDVRYIYNKCTEHGLSVIDIDHLFDTLDDFLIVTHNKKDTQPLFTVNNRYLVILVDLQHKQPTPIKRQDVILNYSNRFGIMINDMEQAKHLSLHPFNAMNIDEIISYLATGQVYKSENFKYKYCVYRLNKLICSLYGNNKQCVLDWLRASGARNIKSEKDTEGNVYYTCSKNKRPYKFRVLRTDLTVYTL